MRKTIISFTLFLTTITAWAQFDYSFDFVSGIDLNKSESSFASLKPEPSVNFRLGGNFNVKIIKNLYVRTGLRYVELSTKVSNDLFIWPSAIGPNGFDPDQNQFEEETPVLTYFENILKRRYIEIPLALRLQFGKNRVSGYFEFGMSPHYYLNSKSTQRTDFSEDTQNLNEVERGGKQIRNTFLLSAGINYKLTDNFELFFQPIIRKYVSSALRSITGEVRWNVGLEFGVRRGFYFEESI